MKNLASAEVSNSRGNRPVAGEMQSTKAKLQDLKGRPVNKSSTGGWKATPYVFGLVLGDSGGTVYIAITLLTYLVTYLNQSSAHAATDVANNLGTTYLLTVLGGFLADSYLGSFWTIVVGAVAASLGYGFLTLCVTYSKLRPSRCVPGPGVHCTPAGTQYTAPLYVALYMIALGAGLIKPNLSSLGADQFDDFIPKERKQGTRFFVYNFFFIEAGFIVATFGGVYLLDHVSPGWCYGSVLILFVVSAVYFGFGAMRFRHRPPTGSFLTRMAQVFVATLRKRNVGIRVKDSVELYETDYPVRGMMQKLGRTPQLRILDRAAAVSGPKDREAASRDTRPWALCTVTQVEETKRILEMLPIWVPMAFVGIVLSQVTSFAIQMASSMDRNLGRHFTIPAASVGGIVPITSMLLVPIYDRLVVPVVRRFNNNPYGFTPLQRMGSTLFFALLTVISAALVERKRVSVVRDLHMEDLVLGSYVLPMRFWWMLPIYVLDGFAEFSFFISMFEFFYRETSMETRSIGSTFSWTALSMGFFFTSILINLVNRCTRHERGGSWLEGQLNNGGIEKFYWLLSVIMLVVFLVFLVVSYWYTYKYDWYHVRDPQLEETQMDPMPLSNTSSGPSRDVDRE